jgi:hypothetical protein
LLRFGSALIGVNWCLQPEGKNLVIDGTEIQEQLLGHMEQRHQTAMFITEVELAI